MSDSILVTYATRFGSTEEVAEAIAAALRRSGLTIDVRPMADITNFSGYRAVLLGSAVNNGSWLPQAVSFVQTHQAALNRLPVALFTVHIQNTGSDDASRRRREAYLDEIRPFLKTVDDAFFAGKFDRRGAAELLPRWMAWLIPPLDFRKWEQIRAWAERVRPLLAQNEEQRLTIQD